MLGWTGSLEFRDKYFPVFMASIYLGICSWALMILSLMNSYFQGWDILLTAKWYMAMAVAMSVFQTFCCFMLLRGGSAWAWGMVGIFMLCLLVSVPTAGWSPHLLLFLLAIAVPLMGLYCINTRRYREMLRFLIGLRQIRNSAKAARPPLEATPEESRKAQATARKAHLKASPRK
jgi:hypothetical protein